MGWGERRRGPNVRSLRRKEKRTSMPAGGERATPSPPKTKKPHTNAKSGPRKGRKRI